MFTGAYIVVCEGASECNYLLHLNRFLATLPPPRDAGLVPLRLIPRPKNVDPKTGVNVGCGGGDYGKVSKCYRSEHATNRSYPFGIWVDADLYVRNDKDCGTRYKGRPAGIPAFDFSVLNFEDFLALHADELLFEKWVHEMLSAGHFNRPLYWEEYEPHYLNVFTAYLKNSLPVDFISVESLRNLFRHMDMLPSVDRCGLTIDKTFAGFMKKILTEAYPQIWS